MLRIGSIKSHDLQRLEENKRGEKKALRAEGERTKILLIRRHRSWKKKI